MAENLNLFTSTQAVIKEALKKLGYDDAMYELLKEPITNAGSSYSSKNGR